MTIALCCDDPKSGEAITKQLSKLCRVTMVSFYNITDFISEVSGRPDIVMLIAQTGSISTETAIAAKEHNPQGKLIWFSDLDFALLSYRLKATYFGMLPLDADRLKTALGYCGIPMINETG